MYIGIIVVSAYILHNLFGIASYESRNYAIIGTTGLILVTWVIFKKKHDEEFEKLLRNSHQ